MFSAWKYLSWVLFQLLTSCNQLNFKSFFFLKLTAENQQETLLRNVCLWICNFLRGHQSQSQSATGPSFWPGLWERQRQPGKLHIGRHVGRRYWRAVSSDVWHGRWEWANLGSMSQGRRRGGKTGKGGRKTSLVVITDQSMKVWCLIKY